MDGVTYEREGILGYFRHERSQGRVPRSPVSRQSLASELLLPNRALKAAPRLLEAQLEARVKMEASLRQQLEVQVAATFEAQTKAKALREALEVAQDLRAAASRIRGQPYGGGGGGDTRLAPYDSSSSGSLMLFGGRRSCW